MTRERFDALIAHAGRIAPEGVEAFIADLEPEVQKGLLPHALLEKAIADNGVPAQLTAKLWDALAQIERDEALVALSQVLAKDAVRALVRCSACEFDVPEPICLTGFAKEAYAFLYALSCVAEGRKALRARGVPERYDEDIPERMIRTRMKKYVQTGDITFDDYPWDMNFYCCAIFLMDRFYFIPYKHGSPEAWRNDTTGKVIALWPPDERIRQDGQLDGVNGVRDPSAVVTMYRDDGESVTAYPVDPAGTVALAPVTLQKAHWRRELADGDYLLALHIPGGEGYTPERVKHSCELALAFYDRYFPELPIKGFWSESWLYDPGLSALLPPQSRILQVQRQFYCYPTPEGEEMARLEVFGDAHADVSAIRPKTRLQKGLADAWARGEHFHTTGMFVLRPEVAKLGQAPYRKEA